MATNCKNNLEIYPIASSELPFFPEFPVRKGVNESSFKVCIVNCKQFSSYHIEKP